MISVRSPSYAADAPGPDDGADGVDVTVKDHFIYGEAQSLP